MSAMSIQRSNTTNLTVGNPIKVILIFALPLLLSNVFQQIYNMTDVTIIGHKLGDDALAAIGTVSIIYNMFSSFVFGMNNGFSVVIGRFFGAKDSTNMRKAIGNSITIASMWIVFLTVFTISLRVPLLNLINTPQNCIETGLPYLTIMLAGLGLSFIYNIEAGILRALGNSFIPLCVLILSAGLNVLLDFLFVYKLEFGLKGAAIATVTSVFIASAVCLIYIIYKVPEIRIKKEDLKLNKKLAVELLTSGLSFGLMFTIVNLGTVVLQSAINSLGQTVIAAHTTARKITELMMMPNSTLSTAVATFVSQNHGAKRYDRVIKGIKQAHVFMFAVISVQIVFMYLFGGNLIEFISGSTNETLISTAFLYLKFDIVFYYSLVPLCQLRMSLQSLGAKIVPLVASFAEMILKVLTAGLLVQKYKYWGIIICEPAIWVICAIYITIAFILNPNIKKYIFTSRK